MKIDGQQFVNAICERLREESLLCTDTNIVIKLAVLSSGELNQLVSFGDVTSWHNERVEYQKNKFSMCPKCSAYYDGDGKKPCVECEP